MGKILVNCFEFIKFAKLFSQYHFTLYDGYGFCGHHTLARKLLSRKTLAGPCSMVYAEVFLTVALRKECGERRGTLA